MTSTAFSSQGSTFKIGTTAGGAKNLTAISKANPGVFTSSAHGLAVGDIVSLASIGGMVELNGKTGVVQYKTTDTFTLAGVDTTGYTTYTSGGTATPVTWQAIANVKSFTAFDGSGAEIDVSNLASTAKEFVIGLQDEGQFSMELDLDSTDAGQIALLAARTAQSKKQYQLTLPNAAVATFYAYAKKVSAAGGVDQVMKRSVDLRITGPVTWS